MLAQPGSCDTRGTTADTTSVGLQYFPTGSFGLTIPLFSDTDRRTALKVCNIVIVIIALVVS